MVDSSFELRTTSDMLLLDLEALGDLEEQKRLVGHGDPKLVDLAGRIEEIAQRVLAGSRRQRELTEVMTQSAEAGTVEPWATIEDVRSASAMDAPQGSRERAEAEALVDRFREEYRRAFEAARRDLA